MLGLAGLPELLALGLLAFIGTLVVARLRRASEQDPSPPDGEGTGETEEAP